MIGSGGREHAIIWKLARSDQVGQIFASPGSFGIANVPKTKNVALDVQNFEVSRKISIVQVRTKKIFVRKLPIFARITM